MAYTVDPNLMDRIRRYGAFDVSACFNCGNCTAACSLSQEQGSFPRRLIRYGQVGMEERLLADKDLWMCYACGECSQTCPRQADPGAYMASARRYAISRYDVTGLSAGMFRWRGFHLLVFLLLSGLVTLLLLWHKGDINGRQLELFRFIPGEVVHYVGVAAFVVIGISGILGMAAMVRRFHTVQRAAGARLAMSWTAMSAAAAYAVKESLGQMRYRQCGDEPAGKPLWPRSWLVHGMILWGFLGLLLATSLDYLLKPIGSEVPLWYPMRLLGTLAGLVCLAGTCIAIYRRITRATPAYARTHTADGFFLGLLAAVVATGLATELVLYLPRPSLFAYVTFLVHVVLAIELVVLLPLTKFAHAIYRPMALFLHRWALASQAQPAARTEPAA